MNLSGIKVSSAEIERVLMGIESINECAAIAVTDQHGGPDRLVIFVVLKQDIYNPKRILQKALATQLNPLFRISEIRLIDALPRTPSNKIMRRELRTAIIAEHQQ